MNIYVGNLPYSIDDEELREAFEPFGKVSSAEVIIDRRTKRSRGYGFVEMANADDGQRAISELNGSDLQGRELRVDESKPKSEKSRKPREQRRNNRQNNRNDASSPPPSGGLMGAIKRLFGG
ncbi:MAG: RNA-binding protein [Pseudomonadota bacterium]